MRKRKNETIEEFKIRKKQYDQERNKGLKGGWNCYSKEYYENKNHIEIIKHNLGLYDLKKEGFC